MLELMVLLIAIAICTVLLVSLFRGQISLVHDPYTPAKNLLEDAKGVNTGDASILTDFNFSDVEFAKIDKSWRTITHILNKDGFPKIFDDMDKVAYLWFLAHGKKNFDQEFQGTLPEDGYGARRIIPKDMIVDVTLARNKWYQATWTTGSDRVWMGNTLPDATTYSAAGRAKLQDANGAKKWGIMIFAILEKTKNPGFEGFHNEINEKPKPYQVMEWQKLGDYHIWKPEAPIVVPIGGYAKMGFQKETPTSAGEPIPLGVIVSSNERFKFTTKDVYSSITADPVQPQRV